MDQLKEIIRTAVSTSFGVEKEIEVTRTDGQFGDYATNIALQLAKELGQSPREIADTLLPNIEDESIATAEVAGPGFINISLTDSALWAQTASGPSQSFKDQNIVLEYSDPNPFKVLHAGHLYETINGDAMARLIELAGATVHRVNFGGDVGLHVGKTMWAIVRSLGGENPAELSSIADDHRAEWLAERYIEGSNAYEDDEKAKLEIIELNQRVYRLHDNNDHSSDFARIYWTTRQWSYDYFDRFYAKIGSGFEKYYPESITTPIGLRAVREQLEKGVYEISNGAVIFNGEPYDLHTRVFINSNGLPTYEAKDVGLTLAKWADYQFDRTIIITGNDIIEYMKVVLKSIEQFEPELVRRTTHLTHGQVKLKGGVKMSSRKGNILRAQEVLDSAAEANSHKDQENIVLAAVKYAFLKQAMGPDIIYDPEESVSLHGNSGPYLQYACVRAQSILKGTNSKITPWKGQKLEAGERTLLRKIAEYGEVIDKATASLAPHYICTYLYELAQTFNSFYEHNRVIGNDRESLRLLLVATYIDRLKQGLGLLGIEVPERM